MFQSIFQEDVFAYKNLMELFYADPKRVCYILKNSRREEIKVAHLSIDDIGTRPLHLFADLNAVYMILCVELDTTQKRWCAEKTKGPASVMEDPVSPSVYEILELYDEYGQDTGRRFASITARSMQTVHRTLEMIEDLDLLQKKYDQFYTLSMVRYLLIE